MLHQNPLRMIVDLNVVVANAVFFMNKSINASYVKMWRFVNFVSGLSSTHSMISFAGLLLIEIGSQPFEITQLKKLTIIKRSWRNFKRVN